jgi:hypothetical protein
VKKYLLTGILGLTFGLIVGWFCAHVWQGDGSIPWLNWASVIAIPGMFLDLTFWRFDIVQYPEGDTWGIACWNGAFWMVVFIVVYALVGLFHRNRKPRVS